MPLARIKLPHKVGRRIAYRREPNFVAEDRMVRAEQIESRRVSKRLLRELAEEEMAEGRAAHFVE